MCCVREALMTVGGGAVGSLRDGQGFTGVVGLDPSGEGEQVL